MSSGVTTVITGANVGVVVVVVVVAVVAFQVRHEEREKEGKKNPLRAHTTTTLGVVPTTHLLRRVVNGGGTIGCLFLVRGYPPSQSASAGSPMMTFAARDTGGSRSRSRRCCFGPRKSPLFHSGGES